MLVLILLRVLMFKLCVSSIALLLLLLHGQSQEKQVISLRILQLNGWHGLCKFLGGPEASMEWDSYRNVIDIISLYTVCWKKDLKSEMMEVKVMYQSSSDLVVDWMPISCWGLQSVILESSFYKKLQFTCSKAALQRKLKCHKWRQSGDPKVHL